MHYTAHRSNSRRYISKFWAKDEGYAQKWHFPYKTSDISETKRSIAKVTTESLEKLVYDLSIGDKYGDLAWPLTYVVKIMFSLLVSELRT